MDLGHRVPIVVGASEQGAQLEDPETAVEVADRLFDLGPEGLVLLLLDELVECLGVGEPLGEVVEVVDVLVDPPELGGHLAGMVGVVPQAGLRRRLLQLGAPLEEPVHAQQATGLVEAHRQRGQGGRDIDALGLPSPPSGTIGWGHLR
jgi:hypothetical protein